jgi:hypothetical protein
MSEMIMMLKQLASAPSLDVFIVRWKLSSMNRSGA